MGQLSFRKAHFCAEKFDSAGSDNLGTDSRAGFEDREIVEDKADLNAAANVGVRCRVFINPRAAVDVVHDGGPRNDALFARALKFYADGRSFAWSQAAFCVSQL